MAAGKTGIIVEWGSPPFVTSLAIPKWALHAMLLVMLGRLSSVPYACCRALFISPTAEPLAPKRIHLYLATAVLLALALVVPACPLD